VIGAADDEDAVVAAQAIYLVEKVAAHRVGHERVQVLEDQVAGRVLPRLEEDLADAVLWAGELGVN
jgi:hypothetical protein